MVSTARSKQVPSGCDIGYIKGYCRCSHSTPSKNAHMLSSQRRKRSSPNVCLTRVFTASYKGLGISDVRIKCLAYTCCRDVQLYPSSTTLIVSLCLTDTQNFRFTNCTTGNSHSSNVISLTILRSTIDLFHYLMSHRQVIDDVL